MSTFREEYLNLTLSDINLLRAKPSVADVRTSWFMMVVLVIGCCVTVPFAAHQWPTSHLLYAAAGIASFAEVTTGVLLLTQAMLLRQNSGLALGVGYLVGGLVILVNLLAAPDVGTSLWLFRLWHGVFVVGVLAYALLVTGHHSPVPRSHFTARAWSVIIGGLSFILLLGLYLAFRPFPLPEIIHHGDYVTTPNLLINGMQFVIVVAAWLLLWRAPRKTVLSVWMEVVACAVAIDIVLFVLGTRLFSVGLYISKLNNLIAATLIFGVIFTRYMKIQGELYKHRIWLVRANRRLARMALTDTLTGLPNRAALEQFLELALARAARANSCFGVCLIDLDNFKYINDHYGHDVGDQMLLAFGKRVSAVLRKEEYFARLGGDEFVLVLENLEGVDQLTTVMRRVTRVLSKPFAVEYGGVFPLNVSIGIALYPDFTECRDLMRAADQALYRAKAGKVERGQNWVMVRSMTPMDESG